LTILKNFAGCVKAGGKVIYATCSAFAEENEEVVNAFLSSDDRFGLRESINPFTGEKCSGFMHVPENYNCDLMFAALLERKK
jgi:16S rRNA (cytosine967-C5)-methyltransferase